MSYVIIANSITGKINLYDLSKPDHLDFLSDHFGAVNISNIKALLGPNYIVKQFEELKRAKFFIKKFKHDQERASVEKWAKENGHDDPAFLHALLRNSK